MVIFNSYVKLPEGTQNVMWIKPHGLFFLIILVFSILKGSVYWYDQYTDPSDLWL